MNVEQYLFRSPSPQQVQIGRPDPSVAKDSETQMQTQTQDTTSTTKEMIELETPKVENPLSSNPNQLLDLYA